MTGTFRTPVRGGFQMLVDLPSLSGLLLTAGVWEWYVDAAFRRLLGPGDVFVDVGANIGYYAILASDLVGDDGHVYALEPAPDTYDRLLENLRINQTPNVTPLRVAAGSDVGEATLFGGARHHDEMSTLLDLPGVPRVRRPEDAPGPDRPAVATRVPVQPAHASIRDGDLARVALVKVDVEGYEAEVLRGLEPMFVEGHRPTLLVEVHGDLQPTAPREVEQFCVRHDLVARWIVDDEGLGFRLAPADRPLELRDLESPLRLSTIPRKRYVVLLAAAGTPGWR
jgi:FkbM family methyltransferase